ncbi:MAG: exopolyphosphatase [Propionibacteriaceae bacterium]|jgi:exopolyphosphatase/guanosine-5'-triphosphate,3'-diphosphate pyrophosphatase|nr:exopolyphosphatase [Propionibacteriaceae bacterium]
MSNTVAAIDCGTNTIRLLITTETADGAFKELIREQRFVGLGQGVDATGTFTAAALTRTFAACEEYAKIIAAHQVSRVRFVATSATRDAANRSEFLTGVSTRIAVIPEVISGTEEASLSFRGALFGLQQPTTPNFSKCDRKEDTPCESPQLITPVLVIDAGGGSTELVSGSTDGSITEMLSMDIGSRRIRERYLTSDPPTTTQIHAAQAQVRQLLSATAINYKAVRTVVAVAGTATTMSALIQRLDVYDRTRVHLSRLTRDEIATLTQRLLGSTVAQIAALKPVQPQRAKVLAAGALLLNEIVQHIGIATLTVSETDILDGIALTLLST